MLARGGGSPRRAYLVGWIAKADGRLTNCVGLLKVLESPEWSWIWRFMRLN
jgi:hypothetical protein